MNWEDVRVGDILKIAHGELAPADMILLDSNNIRDKLPICYINTFQTEGKENFTEIKSSNLTRSKSLTHQLPWFDDIFHFVTFEQLAKLKTQKSLILTSTRLDWTWNWCMKLRIEISINSSVNWDWKRIRKSKNCPLKTSSQEVLKFLSINRMIGKKIKDHFEFEFWFLPLLWPRWEMPYLP